jgi:hypothetical protein
MEIWKDIPDYEGLYQASNLGNIKSLKKNIILRQNGDNYGYMQVILYNGETRKTGKAHRLVGKAFIENPENKPQINHKDGNKKNNHVSNLEWLTNRENKKHAIDTGLTVMSPKTREAQIASIGKVILDTATGIYYEKVKDAASIYGVNPSTIRRWISTGYNNLVKC